jgi:hypothetical protein
MSVNATKISLNKLSMKQIDAHWFWLECRQGGQKQPPGFPSNFDLMARSWWISLEHFNALKPNTDFEPDGQMGVDRS